MTPDRWRQITQIFVDAIGRAPEDRHAWVTHACGDDAALRAEVQRLLDADAGAESWSAVVAATLTRTPTLSRGNTLGIYLIEELIGSGGMGEVYRAFDSRLGRRVAIKVLPLDVASNADALARFTREARAVAALSHPNILAIHEFGEQDGIAYAVTELLQGETLHRRLIGGALPARQAVAIALEIAEGLAAAHRAGIVHRDLKPENIFLTASGSVKILDFGLARVTSAGESTSTGTRPGLVMGTIGYMSPEQVRGETVGSGSDIFAFGCVLHEMLTGERPFDRPTAPEVLAAILRDDPPPLAGRNGVPAGLAAIVDHCLEKRPENRFQSAADLVFAVRTSATASGDAPQIERPPGRSLRRLLPRLAILLLAVGSGAALGIATVWRFAAGRTTPSPEEMLQLTFGRGPVANARFGPNGHDVVFSAAWEGRPPQIFVKVEGASEPLPTGPVGSDLLSVSSRGDVALRLRSELVSPFGEIGTLARIPLVGGTERLVQDGVVSADWLPDGQSLVVVSGLGGRQRLDGGKGTIPYETRGWLSDMRVHPNGSRVAFVEHPWFDKFWGELIVYDLRSGARSVLMSNRARALVGLAWHPRRDEIWFGEYGGVGAVTLDRKERRILSMPEMVRVHDIAPDGRVLLSQENRRGRLLLQRLDGSGARDLSWRFWSMVKGFMPDAQRVLFTESIATGGGLAAIRAIDGSPVLSLGTGDISSVSRDGRWAAVVRSPTADTPGGIVLLPIGTGEPRALVTSGVDNVTMPLFVPQTDEIVFVGRTSGQSNRLYRQAIGSSEPVAISPDGIAMSLGTVSPDGSLVAVSWRMGDVRVVPVRGGQTRRLPSLSPSDLPAGWSADSRWLYLRTGPMGGPEAQLRRVNVMDGSTQAVFTMRVPDPAGVIWVGPTVVSPDERSVAFSYYRLLSSLCLVTGLQDR